MSEQLKSFLIKEVEDGCPFWQAEYEVYSKYEADEVIAELKNQVHEYAQGLYEIQSRTENEIRHGKYKRCLAMAEMCMFKSRISYFEKRSNKSRRMSKWCKRWLKIAEQFKEAK